MAELNLQTFCGRDAFRTYLHEPFTRGESTYATNGHIMVRVARREGVEDNKIAPDVEKVFNEHPAETFSPLPKLDLPAYEEDQCEECHGSGREHQCPDCECSCPDCSGTGKFDGIGNVSVAVGEGLYAGKYLGMMLLLLPRLEIGPTDKEKPLRFRFDGGEGLLMPLKRPLKTHVEAKAA